MRRKVWLEPETFFTLLVLAVVIYIHVRFR